MFEIKFTDFVIMIFCLQVLFFFVNFLLFFGPFFSIFIGVNFLKQRQLDLSTSGNDFTRDEPEGNVASTEATMSPEGMKQEEG